MGGVLVPPIRDEEACKAGEPICLGCYHFTRADPPIEPPQGELDRSHPPNVDPVDWKQAVTRRYAGLGFCTSQPPLPGKDGVGYWPTTHVSWRCGLFVSTEAALRDLGLGGNPQK
jgi:hypothetical protein